MPEGDTIHQVAAALRPDLVGRTPSRIDSRDPAIKALTGRCVVDVQALGKHLLIELDGGVVLRTHLGMYGAWHRYRVGEPWRKRASRASLVLWVDDRVLVCFNAKELQCLTTGSFRWRDWRGHLGPDLIDAVIDYAAIPVRARALLSAETPAVDLLLDQRVASGIGNVYKSELLFIHRVHPLRPLGDLSDNELCELYRTAS
jgi:endonuclease-8